MTQNSIIPLPLHMAERAGSFRLSETTTIAATGAARTIGQQLTCALAPALGFAPALAAASSAGGNVISLQLDAALADRLGPEGYLLNISEDRVEISAAAAAGLLARRLEERR